MKYRYRYWCRYCLYEDPLGCFDGQKEYGETLYDTAEEASKAGYREVTIGSLEYEVVDEEGSIVEVSDYPWE